MHCKCYYQLDKRRIIIKSSHAFDCSLSRLEAELFGETFLYIYLSVFPSKTRLCISIGASIPFLAPMQPLNKCDIQSVSSKERAVLFTWPASAKRQPFGRESSSTRANSNKPLLVAPQRAGKFTNIRRGGLATPTHRRHHLAASMAAQGEQNI